MHGWQFRCREGHLFYARPDHLAPTSYPEIEAWIARQHRARIDKLESKRQ